MAVIAVFDEDPVEYQYIDSKFVTAQTENLLTKYEQENEAVQSID